MDLHIKVKPGSKKDLITISESGEIGVKIKAPPVDGKANDYLVKYLSGIFGIPKSKIKIMAGTKSQFKRLEIETDDEKNILERIKIAKIPDG